MVFAVAQTIDPNWVVESSEPGWLELFPSLAATADGVCVQVQQSVIGQYTTSRTQVRRYDDFGTLLWTRNFDFQGSAWASGSWSFPSAGGSVWLASIVMRESRDSTLVLRRIDRLGTTLANVQREVNASDPRLEFQPLGDGGLAVAWSSRGNHYLRLGPAGEVVVETSPSVRGRLLTLGPGGESYWGSLSWERPPTFEIYRLDVQGSLVWSRTVSVGLDRIGDVAGQFATVNGDTVVTTMGAYKDYPAPDEYWMEAVSLRASDGAVLARRDLLDRERFWAPKPLSHPFGGTVLSGHADKPWPIERLTSGLDLVWSLAGPPFDASVSVKAIDRFGNLWLTGSERSQPGSDWSVGVLGPQGVLRARSRLAFAESSHASEVAFDPTGRAYVLGLRGEYGPEPMTVLAQYPALANPRLRH